MRFAWRIGSLALIALALCVPSASAAVTTHAISGAANPTTQSSTTFGGSSLHIVLDTAYDSYNPPTPAQSGAVVHLDNDFALDTTGLAKCDPATIAALSTSNAIAACPGAQVGSGSATARDSIGSFGGTITVFNGTLSGGHPTMLFHFDFGFGDTGVAVGVIGPSSRGGDFGTQIDISSLAAPGVALTEVDATLSNQEPSPGHHYVSARCNDADHTWNYAVDFSYADASTLSASATQTCSGAQHTLTVLKRRSWNGDGPRNQLSRRLHRVL